MHKKLPDEKDTRFLFDSLDKVAGPFRIVLPITLLALFIDYVWAWLLDFLGPVEISLAAPPIQARSCSVSIETSGESLSPQQSVPSLFRNSVPNTT